MITQDQMREIVSALSGISVVLAGYYAELIRLNVPPDVAKAMTVAMQTTLVPPTTRPDFGKSA